MSLRNSITIVLALTGLLGGCANRPVSKPTVHLDLFGPVAVDVESFNGDVVIKASPDVSQPRVEVVLETTHGYLRRDEGLLSLDNISYEIDVVGGPIGQVLQIRASTTDAEPYFQRAHFKIHVPEVEGVAIRTHNGKVDAFGVAGSIEISTTNDRIRLASPRPIIQPVTIVNNNGDIEMRVRGESKGNLDFRTVGGWVSPAIRYGETVVYAGTDATTFLASWNRGDNPIVLRAVDGDIRFSVLPDPLGIGEYISR